MPVPPGRSAPLEAMGERAPFDQDPRRWWMLALLSAALFLGMSEWFTAAVAAPQLMVRWDLSPSQVGLLTTVVQLGFVGGTAVAAVLNLADIVSSRRYFAASALLAAVVNAGLLAVPGFGSALVLRFLTGFFLAGVYPPAMKMISTWFRSARGLAIGTIVGALTLGKAGPYLLKAVGHAGMEAVVLGASAAGVVSSVLVLLAYREGPSRFDRRPFSWGLVGQILRHRPTMLATGGYLGHMFELYAGWLLVGPFFGAVYAARGNPDAEHLAALWSFLVIGSGGVGAVLGGVWADRWGRERVAVTAMAASGLCSLTLGWLLEGPLLLAGLVALAWGVTIVADSAQFSAVVTEVAPRHAVGTALTLQTMLGFGLTGVSMQLGVWLADVAGWGPALSFLAVGPAAGIVSMLRLKKLREGAAAGLPAG